MTPVSPTSPGLPIAVIAMGAMFPGRGTTHGFFRDLIEGVDAIGDVPASHWRIEDYYDADPTAPDKTYGRRGGFLSPKAFDPVRFGLPPAALPSTDTSQLLALMVADRVMADVEAAIGGPVDRSRTSVVLGVASATELTGHMAARLQRPVWERGLRASGLSETEVRSVADHLSAHYTEWTEATFPGLLGNVVAGRIANRLDLGGSNYVTDAACASSLSALQVAMHELRAGSSDMAFAGGVDALNDILMYLCFSKTPALSPTGDCRPFSSGADGTILGEGIGMVALKRLDDAERDGDRIHAVIRGLGGASDGRATAIYAPLATGQARALRRAYEDACYGPETVELVEAHGTGTQAGDKAELDGLTRVFADGDGGGNAPDRPWCAVGSVKSQIGHTKAAAGAASLIKAVMALHRRVLPPTLKIDAPAPVLGEDSPFHVSGKARPWVSSMDTPRRASVSSFGFGGSNFHATLEEYSGANVAVRHRLWPAELLLFSGTSPARLARAVEDAREACERDEALAHFAETSASAFDPGAPCAACIVAGTAEALASATATLLERIEAGAADDRPMPGGIALRLSPAPDGAVAFLFAGQGSQYVGMGADLAIHMPWALDAWTEAARHRATGPLRLHDKAFPPTAYSKESQARQHAALTQMQHAQPAIAVTALAQLDIVNRLGLKADMAGGHSFGELVALHLGGAMDREALLTLSLARARAMIDAAAGSDGAMLAVRASAEAIVPYLANHPGIGVANDNGPAQIALSGSDSAISAVEADLAEAGFTVRRLPVASAFHSPIVADAVAPFRAALVAENMRPPSLPVYANATARPYGGTAGPVRTLLANQIGQPVRFREMVEAMYRDGARTFVEFGPGSVVSGLVADTLGDRPATLVRLDRKRGDSLTAFLEGLGALALAGHSLALDQIYGLLPAPPLPDPPAKFAVEISGANYGKPDPAPPAHPLVRVASDAAPPDPDPRRPDGAPPVPVASGSGLTTASPAAPAPTVPIARSEPLPPSELTEMTETMSQQPPANPMTRPINGAVDIAHTASGDTPMVRAIAEISAAHRHYLDVVADLARAAAGAPSVAAQPVQRADARIAPAAATHVTAHLNGQANGHAGPNGSSGVATGSAPKAAAPEMALQAARASAPAPAPMAAPVAPAPTAPAPAAPPPGGAVALGDLTAALTTIIAEKTGYPEEMLANDMHLEAELGIDSIKQVEILSAIREAFPDLPQIDPEDMGELTTIDAISTALGGTAAQRPAPPRAPAPQSNPAPPAPAPSPTQAPQAEPFTLPATRPASPVPAPKPANGSAGPIVDLLKAVIAEKTGYPVEMLEDDMDLEAELGVDSIKQVEILAALREARPDLREADPEEIAELRSISDLAAFFQ
ncbi:MAG: beta-ketoacyl synthase N-terminal-like domain-containing protein [Pseudomonadota bacterium]